MQLNILSFERIKMKRCLFLLLTLISTNALAHGHWPQKIKSQYMLTQSYDLKFNLSNHFPKRTCFDIEINGKIAPQYKTCLAPQQKKNFKIPVSSGVDKKITNVVCSIAVNEGAINTRMCTTATTMFPHSKLAGGK